MWCVLLDRGVPVAAASPSMALMTLLAIAPVTTSTTTTAATSITVFLPIWASIVVSIVVTPVVLSLLFRHCVFMRRSLASLHKQRLGFEEELESEPLPCLCDVSL